MITVFHNPRCSKSRAALSYLEEKNISCNVVKYLDTPPSKDELKDILKKLGKKPLELIRKGEAEFKPYKGQDLSDDELIDLMVKFPKLIERPIVINDDKAVVARPTEDIDKVV